MNKLKNLYRVIALILVLASMLSLFAACKDEKPSETPGGTTDQTPDKPDDEPVDKPDPNDPNYGKNIEDYQKKITFKVVNGKWNDGGSADKVVYVTLAVDGVWDVSGSGNLTAPSVGSMPDANCRAGSWDNVPPTTVSGTDEAVYTYTYKSAVASYTVEHYTENADGSYSLFSTDMFNAAPGATVVAIANYYVGYCFNADISDSRATLTAGSAVVLKLYYEIDENGDSIPDKYQKKVTFKVVNGKWGDNTTEDKVVYVTLMTNGVWDINGSGALSKPSVGSMPNTDYIKGSWSKTPPATVSGTDDVTYTYKYKKSENPVITDQKVNYTVEHYKDGTKVETEKLTGYEGATVTASPKTFDGYCLNTQTSSVSATLYTSGSIVLKLYYDTDANGDGIPDKYQKKVTFKVANGKWNDGTSADKTLYLTLEKAGMWDTNGSASLTVPAVGSMPSSGYKAGKWNPSLSATVSGKDDATYTYTYAKSDDVVAPDNTADYTVEHYKANPNGSYELISTEKLSAIIGATVTASPKTFAGFCLNTQSSTASATLVNGTVLRLYYDTDENADKVPDKYQKKVTFKVANGKWNDGTTADKVVYVTLTKDGKWDAYGSGTLNAPAVGSAANSGYKAGTWNPAITSSVSGASAVTYTYTYVKADVVIPTVSYTVEYYKDGAKVDTQTLSGAEGSTVTATVNTPAGYCLDTQKSTVSATLTNGTVLKVYYEADTNSDNVPDKNQKKVTFKVVNGKWNDGTSADKTVYVTLTNGSGTLTAPAVGSSANSGYKAGTWNTSVPTTVSGTDAVTYTYTYAKADAVIPTVNYTVEYYKDGAKVDTQTLSGAEGSSVTATVNTPAGYCLDTQKSTVSAALANGTVLKVYYEADTNSDKVPDKYQKKVTFKVVNGKWNDNTTADKVVYVTLTSASKWDVNGSGVLSAPAVGSIPNADYRAGSWNTSVPATVSGSAAVTYTYTYAKAEATDKKVEYTVEHYQENRDGSYTRVSSEALEGIAGATVTATAKTYTGYTLDSQESKAVLSATLAEGTVLKLYYAIDKVGGTNGADNIPDKYQKKVTFTVKNGMWNDGTSADVTLYVTLTSSGKWSTSGSGALTAPAVGANPSTDYKAGAWNTSVPTTVSGNTAVTYTYTYVTTTISYKVEHYQGSTLKDTETLSGKEGATVTAAPKTYSGYCLDTQKTTLSATLTSGLVIKLYYETDANGDSVPDKYQKKITFKVVNGKWDDNTTANKVVYVTLTSAGKWDASGSGALTAPAVGAKPNSGYKVGSWNTNLPASVSGTSAVTYTYTYSSSSVSYTVEHYKGTSKANTETLRGNEGATVTATPKTYSGYCLNTQTSTLSATLTSGLVLKLYYDIDANGDSVPDKYQKKVTFTVLNGAWNDGSKADIVVYVTLKSGSNWSESGSGALSKPAVGSKPNNNFQAGSWASTVPSTVSGTAAATYTYKYKFVAASSTTVAGLKLSYGPRATVVSGSSKPHFPSIVELKYQSDPSKNGILVAAMSIHGQSNSMGYIVQSTDNGLTWKKLATPVETIRPEIWGGNMGHIYELPAQLGDLPAGTLIYSSNTVDYNWYSHIGVWASKDAGKTWTEISIVAYGGGLEWGIWEPVMFYDNGYLYCFYSDDTRGPDVNGSNPGPDQILVYQRSKDGINWEAPVDVLSYGTDFAARPGMPVITKMGNGEYFLVYEYVYPNEQSIVYYKTTKDITSWNPSDKGTQIKTKEGYYLATSPACVWSPAGGDKGTLIVAGQYQLGVSQSSIFISRDYGKTWTATKNPLPNTNYNKFVEGEMSGYRPLLVVGKDPSVIHYINTTTSTKLEYVTIKIGD